ncbi:PspA-associated protein PspAB [Streptomyces sp. NBC_00459]|uniref:PspA-associated protein PspAB n=1 Tax=Streptomyces sp. NBC_00459 TaxID=2975749 RepID=UPI002E18E107
MGLLDILLGRTKPVAPDLDRLFGLPSAAVTLQAAAGFTPTGGGSVCFASVEGAAFDDVRNEVQALLDADAERTGPPVELVRDEYGYSWLVSRRGPEELPALVGDLHAVNSALEASGFGPQLLCSVVGFEDVGGSGGSGASGQGARRLGLVYLYKRGTFYPFSPLADGEGQRRDSALELQVRAALAGDLRIEQDLSRWFPVWGAPGL